MNKVILLGHIGQDAQLTTIQSGSKVAKFSIATTKRWKDKEGNKKEQTEWHNIECWDKVAEIAEKYFKKGTKLLVEGEIKTDQYEKDGVKQYRTKIVMKEFEFAGSNNTEAKSEPEPSTTAKPEQHTQPENDLPF